ncbi:MAG: T9SS type A sorting domain-containing protein [Bacteroidales bacterium]
MYLIVMVGCTAIAQFPQIKSGVFVRNYHKEEPVIRDPVEKINLSPVSSVHPAKDKNVGTSTVTVLDLGTSANLAGYTLGTRTMLWADDNLKVVANIHRLGPGTTPPALYGYLGMDLGVNMGKTQADWTTQIQVQAATLAASPSYYDASGYPSAGIYNPAGNTSLANAFLTWFAPNHANLIVPANYGGYGYGTANLANHTDTTKHIRWYDGHPYTWLPSGFTISSTGVVHMVDGEYDMESGTPVYKDSIIYGRGVWNAATHDFDYTFRTLAFPCVGSYGISDCKIACSPDGNTVWMSVLTNFAGATPLRDSTWFPVLRKSSDGGLTWGDPIVVQLDGPGGIEAIKNHYSDYFILNLFAGPPWPSRDEIPYTTAFDHSLCVDKWGAFHIGVAVGYAPGGYQIATGIDSLINVFDLVYCTVNYHFTAVHLGTLKTLRGTWGNYTCDNRVYISRNKAGDKVFVTWNDTRVEGELNNQDPDVYARGFDVSGSKLTTPDPGTDASNVTSLSAIAREAYYQCTSPTVFTDGNKYTLPICTQWFNDANADSRFKYVEGFSFTQFNFTISMWPSLCGFIGGQQPHDPIVVNVYPNPVDEVVRIRLNLEDASLVSFTLNDLLGHEVLSVNERRIDPGNQELSADVSALSPGIYFLAIRINERLVTRKIVVE